MCLSEPDHFSMVVQRKHEAHDGVGNSQLAIKHSYIQMSWLAGHFCFLSVLMSLDSGRIAQIAQLSKYIIKTISREFEY